MSWLKLVLQVTPDLEDELGGLFMQYGHNRQVIVEKNGSLGPNGERIIDPQAPVMLTTYLVQNEQTEQILRQIRSDLLKYQTTLVESLKTSEQADKDWPMLNNENSIYRVGNRIVIKLPEQEYTAQPGEIVAEIGYTSIVFGPNKSGLHPSTTLALELIEDLVTEHEHQRVLDIGTGSGTLAIVAGLIGASRIVGVDISKLAIETARENIERNGLTAKIHAEAGSLSPVVGTIGEMAGLPADVQQPPAILTEMLPFDAIFSNTIDNTIVLQAADLARALRVGGLLITSGITIENAERVDTALQTVGMILVDSRNDSGWVAFAHRKNNSL